MRQTVHPVIWRLGDKITYSGKSLRLLEAETGINKSMLSRITQMRAEEFGFSSIVMVADAFGYELRLVRKPRNGK